MRLDFTLEDFGYKGDEILMDIYTGSVDTAENWISDAKEWEECNKGDHCGISDCDCATVRDQFGSLELVTDK